jgi:PAS domain S-box-containing protein
MAKPLHVLIVEDSDDDTLLLVRELRRAGYEIVHERVDTAEAMKSALMRQEWDLVISDYMMPKFNGIAALQVLQLSGQDLPFIIVSGNIGEDIAVAAMRAGAHDYIIKGNLARLVPAVERELREAGERRKRSLVEDQLRQSRQRLFETLEKMNEGFFTLDREWRFSYVNAEAARLWQKSRAALLGNSLWDVVPNAVGTVFDQQYRRAVREQVPVHFDAVSPLLGIWVEARAYPTEDGLAVYFHDITGRKQSEEQIARLNRLYSVLSKVNEAIVRSNDTQNLYEEICRITVQEGSFKMAWIGITDPASKRVVPTASFGDTGGYLQDIHVIAADVPEGKGPTGRAVFEGKYRICSDIAQDAIMFPWRDKALSHGYRTSAAFPLRSGKEVIGALTVYGDQPRSLANEEIGLLSSLTDDVSYAIDSLANERRRKEAEEQTIVTNALLKLFTQKFSRKEYLDAACGLIREWSGVRHVGIRIVDPEGGAPFESCKGYNDAFLELEGQLSLHTPCICTRIVEGTPGPSDLCAMTPSGSFFSGDTAKFIDQVAPEDREHYRGVCMKYGFQSLGVIPIRHRETPVGAIHLADEREGMLPQKAVLFLEQLAYIIGEAVFRFSVEDELRTNFTNLQKTTELLERFFSTTHMLVAYMDRDFNYIRVNRAYAEADHHLPEFYVGRGHFALYPHEENERIFRQVVDTGEPFEAYERPLDFSIQPEQPTSYWDWNVLPVKETDGRVSGLVFTLIDVSARMHAEDELRRAVAYNRSLIEASLDPLVTISPDGKITDMNAATEIATGLLREDLINTDFSEYFTEPAKARSGYLRAFREGKVMDYALDMRHRNGQTTAVLFNASIYRDEAGTVKGIFAAARDITALREAERRTMVTNNLLKLFTQTYSRKVYLDSVIEIIRSWSRCRNVGVRITDRDGNIPYVACEGFDEDFVRSERALSLSRDRCACTRVVTGELDAVDASSRTPDGSLYYNNSVAFLSALSKETQKQFRGACQRSGYQSLAVIPIRYREKILGAIHLADLREGMFPPGVVEFLERMALIIGEALYRFNIEEEQMRLASALESTAEAVVITDPGSGKIQYVNSAFEQVTGYTKDEALGRTLHLLDSGKHDEAFYRKLRETLARDGVWRGQLINKRKDGTLYYEDCTFSPVLGPSGEVMNYVSLKRDVTEKLRLESIAESVSTMDSIGFIFSGVRHEIGNPINSINMILGLLKAKLPSLSLEAVTDYIDRVMSQIARIEFLLNSLKSYNMYETQDPQDLRLASFMDQFLPLISEDFSRKGVALNCQLDPQAESVYADPRALQQVLLNLLTNASDAVNGREHPKVNLGVFKSGSTVRIEVEDNGCGIPEDKMKDLFKPFYTTKAKGTGLGLVIVKKMLARMNGTIELESRKDQGTLVTISLPEEKHGQR